MCFKELMTICNALLAFWGKSKLAESEGNDLNVNRRFRNCFKNYSLTF